MISAAFPLRVMRWIGPRKLASSTWRCIGSVSRSLNGTQRWWRLPPRWSNPGDRASSA